MADILTLTMNPALDIAASAERIVPTQKIRCTAPRYDPGGGGINVARAVHILGGDALAIFPAGGASGERIAALLREEGVPHLLIPIAGLTRESIAVSERATGAQYRLVLPGPELEPGEHERCLDELARAAETARFIVASGSLPPGVPSDFYVRVAALARAFGKPLFLDASGPALRVAGAGVFLLKPSLDELAELVARPVIGEAEEERAAHDAVTAGFAEVVVVSLGARGALVATAAGCVRLAAIPVRPNSSVGAGDCMLAGIVLAYARGADLPEAVRFGMAAATAALLRSGTQLCRRSDAEAFYAGISADRSVLAAGMQDPRRFMGREHAERQSVQTDPD